MTFNQQQALENYTELMCRISVGAYEERSNEHHLTGTWPEDGIEESVFNLEELAARNDLEFIWHKESSSWTLEPMSDETRQARALGKYSRLYELLESGEDSEEYPGGEEEIEDELSDLRRWARKQDLVFTWNGSNFGLEKASEDEKATWKRERWLHRHAGLIGSFMLQDKHFEEGEDAATVDYTSILGVLPHKENEPRTWLMRVDATADSGFGYHYQTELFLAIRENPEDEEDKPIVKEATDKQVKQVTREESETQS
jgi:hypothetical protein